MKRFQLFLKRELKKNKIKLIKDTSVNNIDVRNNGVSVGLSDGKVIQVDQVLVSIGRAVNSDNIGLEDMGIEKGVRGEIIVDSRMQTNIDGIYAIGDVTGGIMLAHLASKEGTVAAESAMGRETEINYNVIPAAIFTSPEIGSVGLREKQAVEKGLKIKIGRFQVRSLGKAHAIGEISGLFKIIADEETDMILGAHIIGPHASDLIHEVALAMEKGLTAKDIANTIHAHPTLSEGIMEAAEDVHGSAIHSPRS